MKIKKIQLGAGIMAFLVCLVMIVTVTYRAQAGEVIEKEPVLSEGLSPEVEKELNKDEILFNPELLQEEGLKLDITEEIPDILRYDGTGEENILPVEEEKEAETFSADEPEEAFEAELPKPKKEKKAKKEGKSKKETYKKAGKKAKTLKAVKPAKKPKSEKSEKNNRDKKKAEGFGLTLSKNDLAHLYRLVQSEVGYMDEKSKMLVTSVVLNRVKAKQFPNTVPGVVLQKTGRTYQFSPVKPGGRYWTCTVSASTKKAVDKTLKSGDCAKGALYFVAKHYTSRRNGSWFDRNLRWLLHHGGQDYYSQRK